MVPAMNSVNRHPSFVIIWGIRRSIRRGGGGGGGDVMFFCAKTHIFYCLSSCTLAIFVSVSMPDLTIWGSVCSVFVSTTFCLFVCLYRPYSKYWAFSHQDTRSSDADTAIDRNVLNVSIKLKRISVVNNRYCLIVISCMYVAQGFKMYVNISIK